MVNHFTHLPHQVDAGVAHSNVDGLGQQHHLLQDLQQGWIVLAAQGRGVDASHTSSMSWIRSAKAHAFPLHNRMGSGCYTPCRQGVHFRTHGLTLLAMAAIMKSTASVTSQGGFPSFRVAYSCRREVSR